MPSPTSKATAKLPKERRQELENLTAGYAFVKQLSRFAGSGSSSIPVDRVSEQDLLTEVERMLSLLKQPTPNPYALLEDSPNLRERTVTVQALTVFKWLGQTDVDILLAHDSSGKIRRLFERTWSHMIKWMKFLLENAQNIGARGSDPVLIAQSVVGYVCLSLGSLSEPDCFPEKIDTDPAILSIALTAYLKQDVTVLIALDVDGPYSNAPGDILADCINARAKDGSMDTLRVLSGHEREIVNLALLHLRHAQEMPADTSVPLRKIRGYIEVLIHSAKIPSFGPHIIKNKTVTTVIASFRYIIEKYNGSSSLHDSQFALTVEYILILLATFCSAPRADLCIRTALSARVIPALSSLSQLVKDPSNRWGEGLVYVLRQLAGYTICRTIANNAAKSVEGAFAKDPQLGRYQLTGELWSLLQRYATERAICKFLFDEAYRRNGRKCWTCRSRIPRYEIRVCGGCRALAFCSRKCQKSRWKAHKYNCAVTKQNVVEIESEFGRYDNFMKASMAKCDLNRLLPSICDQMRRRNPQFTFADGCFEMDYTVTSDSLYPVVSFTRHDDRIAKVFREEIRLETAKSPYDCVTSGAATLFQTHVKLPHGETKTSRIDFVPVFTSMMDIAYDSDHPTRSCKARPVHDVRFRRVECFMKEFGRFGKLVPLDAIRDDVDDILYELERVTETNPGWTLSQRVKCAAATVEKEVRKEGRDLYEMWIS